MKGVRQREWFIGSLVNWKSALPQRVSIVASLGSSSVKENQLPGMQRMHKERKGNKDKMNVFLSNILRVLSEILGDSAMKEYNRQVRSRGDPSGQRMHKGRKGKKKIMYK